MTAKLPPAVQRALQHVRAFHPDVDTVVFFNDARWLYVSSETHTAPRFSKSIDNSILEAACDEVDNDIGFPAVFQMED